MGGKLTQLHLSGSHSSWVSAVPRGASLVDSPPARPIVAQEVISPRSAARASMRLRLWRTGPSSSEVTATVVADEDAPEIRSSNSDVEVEKDDDDGLGASILLHPSITNVHRGPLPQVVVRDKSS